MKDMKPELPLNERALQTSTGHWEGDAVDSNGLFAAYACCPSVCSYLKGLLTTFASSNHMAELSMTLSTVVCSHGVVSAIKYQSGRVTIELWRQRVSVPSCDSEWTH